MISPFFIKKYRLQFVLSLLLLFSKVEMYAEEPPPPPPTGCEDCPPIPVPPGEMPINDHLIPILLISLLFGAYMIYRYNQKQKNPV